VIVYLVARTYSECESIKPTMFMLYLGTPQVVVAGLGWGKDWWTPKSHPLDAVMSRDVRKYRSKVAAIAKALLLGGRVIPIDSSAGHLVPSRTAP